MLSKRSAAVTLNKALNRFGVELNRAGVLGTALAERDGHRQALETERSRNTLAELAETQARLASLQATLNTANDALAKHRNLYPDSLYEKLFPAESLRNKRFYNFGAGNWRHQYWTNVDYSSDYYAYPSSLIDINWDISLLQPIPVETGSAELVFCSHTVEHLQNHHIDHMLAEACRILKPGGIARVTCPNAELLYWAFMRQDGDVARHYGYDVSYFDIENSFTPKRMTIYMLNEIATQLVQGAGPDRLNCLYQEKCEEIQRIFDTMPMTEAFDHFMNCIDFEAHKLSPGNHVNWWTNEKLSAALRRAGFKHVIVSIAGASISPVMRNREVFDYMLPTSSIFVEAIKG
jgi:SAM-dependent methyltransferase